MEQKVGPGKYVEFSYKLFDDANGEILFETPQGQPDMMVYGVSHEIVPGLVETIRDMKVGDKFEVVLPPMVAFGEYNPDDVIELPRDIFMRDGEMAEEVKVGAQLPMMTAEGFRVLGTVLEIGDKIKMDFNHPFAGKTVRYEGKIETVREATPEELTPAHGCGGGCGGCGGSCGDSCEGGCDCK